MASMRVTWFFAAIVAALLLLPGGAGALTLELSDVSSNETPASALSATLEFGVVDDTLTLTVTNSSAYQINELYFNAQSNVTGLELTGVTGGDPLAEWSLGASVHANGFGTFDFAILNDARPGNFGIDPGGSAEFTMTISGTGTYESRDFRDWSMIPPGHTVTLAAAKFVSGPGGDSAHGGVIPEPDARLVFTAGLLIVAWQIRGRRAKPLAGD
jgi:hypothetical protein